MLESNQQSDDSSATRTATTKERVKTAYSHTSNKVGGMAVSLWFSIAVLAGRVAAKKPGTGPCPNLPESLQALRDFLLQIQSVGQSLALLIAVVMLTYAGFLLIKGGPEDVERAQKIVVRVFAGLILVFIAGGLVQWSANLLCTTGGA